jgi:PAT family beta-lactamase induction signal transducer AmpG
MLSTKTNLILMNSRLLAILCLGFSSGLPLALTGPTLQAWFTESHINLLTIGALSLLGIPYTFKFLWAPLMDHYGFKGFGKRKGWILLMQLGLVVTLLILASLDPTYQTKTIGIVALIVAFFSASQDISINAYTTDVLAPEERGLGAAYTVFAYRVAMLVSGGLALVFADYLGFKTTYQIMAGLMALSMIATYFAPRAHELAPTTVHIFETTKEAFKDFLQQERWIIILLFLIFYKFGDALALQLMMPFLLKGLHFSLTEVGLAYKLVSFIAMMLGGFIGGILLSRWHIYRALLVFGLAQAFSNLTFVLLALLPKQFLLMTSAIFIENFCSGLSTAALLAYIMSLCNHRYSASQFALFSAVASFGRVFLGPFAGFVVDSFGWAEFYVWSFILCLPGIIFLLLLKKKVLQHAHA